MGEDEGKLVGIREIWISSNAVREAEDHMSRLSPKNGWGLLIGSKERANAFIPLMPDTEEEGAFIMDDTEAVLSSRRMESIGRDIIAYVHSHPNGPPRLSKKDAGLAEANPDVIHLVVDLSSDPHEWGGGRFLGDGDFTAAKVRIAADT